MTPLTHNTLFSKLVTGQDDLVGHIAYSLYKQEKIEFIAKHTEVHGVEPDESARNIFFCAANIEGRLDSYRERAVTILAEFSQEMLEDQAGELQGAYDAQLIRELKSSRPFWRGVWENTTSNLLALAFIALFFAVIWGLRFGPAEVVGEIFGVDIKQRIQIPANEPPAIQGRSAP